ncbi:GNAT family N-acetyltransferase [Geminicoccaceae bacterium 1502E]|nr:GNAT family N-acetyltransferase [Geminicoccaceae bacterium 1502E]
MKIVVADALPLRAKQADFSFEIDSRIVAPFDAVPFRTEMLPSRQKVYGLDEDLFEPRDSRNAGLFVAGEGETIAGYVAISRAWNKCAEIVDIAVARPFRGRGLATSLMNTAALWAHEVGLHTMRLETQTTNVAACRFYQHYGFMLGGYDRYLYRGLGPEIAQDIALFWYLHDATDRWCETAPEPARPAPRHVRRVTLRGDQRSF